MTTDDFMAVALCIALAALCFQLNLKAGTNWLRFLTLWSMLGFAALAGYAIIKAILL
jgi:hypothetical protein